MVDFISQVGGNKQVQSPAQQKTPKVGKGGAGASTASPQTSQVAPPATSGKDELVLTEISQRASSESGFDPKKVEAIKRSIAEGNYPLDARKIAESFSSLENLIGGSTTN